MSMFPLGIPQLLLRAKAALAPSDPTPLKWFFAYSEDGDPDYLKLIKVAVLSARANTTLVPHCVYDGKPSAMTEWLERQGVTVFFHQSPLRSHIIQTLGNTLHARGAAGAVLRIEIPRILTQAGLPDRFVLYTDCDVMFEADVPELKACRPKFFACAPEFSPRDWSYVNTGVMILNVPALHDSYPEFIAFIREQFDQSWVADQTGYNRFYEGKIDRLPIEYNWKPYWGDSRRKKIVHFHGPKPIHRQGIEALKGTEHAIIYNLYSQDRETYNKMFTRWDEFLLAAEAAPNQAAVSATEGGLLVDER